jgi:hypothetical protein
MVIKSPLESAQAKSHNERLKINYPQNLLISLWIQKVKGLMMNEVLNEFHGDEPEIAAEARRVADEFEAEHADDWKYTDLETYEHD